MEEWVRTFLRFALQQKAIQAAPKPDISSLDALKRALLGAKSITYIFLRSIVGKLMALLNNPHR
jgi:hypothetical protein